MSDWLKKALSLFQNAADLEPSERERYLSAQCGSDSALRREVEALLSGDRAADDQLDETVLGQRRKQIEQAFGQKSQLQLSELAESDVIGGYRLVPKLAEGGMGLVFEAEQGSPRRRVALKVLRPTRGLGSTHARFRHEAQVLGLLQHVDIAQIYEAGTFDLGHGEQPFFAMEWT
jgi:serine/threonine protein kinase